MKYLYLLLPFSICLITSCQSTQTETGDKTNITSDSLNGNEGEVTLYSLPAPMQIPSSIKEANPVFYKDILVPDKNPGASFSSSFKKALNLGVFGVDMGYATVYEQGQTSINYLSNVVRLADELNITGSIDPQVVDQYKNNLTKKDTLSYLILKSFNDINTKLTESNRNDIAILILTGSFIEGVHLTTAIYAKQKSPVIANLIGQQKLFLDNILEILPQYNSDEEIKNLNTQLAELKPVYDSIQFKVSQKDETTKKIDDIDISDDQIAIITQKISSIRSQIIK